MDITEENHQDVADHLFRCQLSYNLMYHVQILEYGWGDDDTDYARTMFNVSESLMDLAYDHGRDDLIHFLFTLREEWQAELTNGPRRYMDPLHYLDSAGGTCEELQGYLDIAYKEEERLEQQGA